MKLENIEPKRVFYYFEKLSQIPRGSGNEKEVSDYIKSVGEDLGLETIQDEVLNVIIRKPATKGYEDSEGVIIQGHMDMVCEKEDGIDHDFTRDPIELVVDGDFIRANGTTLGADNGIAVAMGLAILEDKSLDHPALELVVTTSEETDLGGALGLSDKLLKGKRLLNIDSEEEGILTTGSAGGELIEVKLPTEYEKIENFTEIDIEVRGLMGGHSGMEIHKDRGNSNKILSSILKELRATMDIRLVSIEGGTKDNAIPRQSKAKIAIEAHNLYEFQEKIEEIKNNLLDKYRPKEPEIEIIVTKGDTAFKALKEKILNDLLILLEDITTGVFSWIPGNEDIVESSSNLAVVSGEEDKITIQISTRSSSKRKLLELREKILGVVKNTRAEYTVGNGYPEWEHKPESKLRDTALELYKEMFGKEMVSTVIHAGLECGVFAEKYPDLDIISFGPNMYDVHTPMERLSISSTERTYKYLVNLLKRLK